MFRGADSTHCRKKIVYSLNPFVVKEHPLSSFYSVWFVTNVRTDRPADRLFYSFHFPTVGKRHDFER